MFAYPRVRRERKKIEEIRRSVLEDRRRENDVIIALRIIPLPSWVNEIKPMSVRKEREAERYG